MPGPSIAHRARWTLFACAAALAGLAAAACAPAGTPPTFPVAQTKAALSVQVVDQLNDVGRMPSVAIGAGNEPVVSYLLYQPIPKPGALPAPVVAGVPQPPAVMLATRGAGIWSRQSVTPQKTSPAQGDAPEITNKKLEAIPGVNSALAVDPQHKDHVIWATPAGLFYADNSGGAFGAPEQISKAQTFGADVAVGADGTVWVSYYEGSTVKAASRTGTTWMTEDVATTAGAPGLPAVTTSIAVGSSGPVIAYGDNGSTMVATRSGTGWTTTTAGPGGYGVSIAVDSGGTAHVASYDSNGDVTVADGSGGSFAPTTIAHTKPGPGGQGNGSWSTDVAVDDQGNQYVVFADTATHVIDLAVRSGGSFRVRPIQNSELGANPSLAVDPQGNVLAIAWYDTENQNLDVAVTSSGKLVIAFSPLPQSPLAAPSASAPSCKPSGTTIQVVAKNIAFDKSCLAAPANTPFTIDFNNQDPGTPHNVEIYTTSPTSGGTRLGGASGPSDIVTGPATKTYSVPALKPGSYYFQCDIHPTTMFGTFVVSK